MPSANTPFRVESLLFDLDGTLIDSIPDITRATNSALTALNLPAANQDDLRSWVGNGAAILIKRALTDQVDGEPDPILFKKALALFFDYYIEEVFVESTFYPDVTETLENLKARKFKIACVTNKPMQHTQALLKQSGIKSLFDYIVAGDTLTAKKPDPAPLLYACDKIGVPPRKSIMVGDSINDIQAAKNAGIPSIGLTYGYNHGIDLSQNRADILIDHFSLIQKLVEKY